MTAANEFVSGDLVLAKVGMHNELHTLTAIVIGPISSNRYVISTVHPYINFLLDKQTCVEVSAADLTLIYRMEDQDDER